jgi:serine/threonine protein kinase
MPKVPDPGSIIANRYTLISLLGTGFAGSVWRATDERGRKLVLKVTPSEKSKSDVVATYREYLEIVYRQLIDQDLSVVDVPLDYGISGPYFYEVFKYHQHAHPLAEIIASRSFEPAAMLNIIAEVARGLAELHQRSIVHCDIKPHNILVVENGFPKVLLIDLGMARVIEGDESVLIFGTPKYMHSDLLRLGGSIQTPGFSTIIARKAIGPYIDLYSLGVVAVEMLTGTSHIPIPLTIESVVALLCEKNQRLRLMRQSPVQRLGYLILNMLTVRINSVEITAELVRQEALQLVPDLTAEGLGVHAPATEIDYQTISTGIIQSNPEMPKEFKAVLRRIETLSHDLLCATAAFVAREKTLESVPSKERDESMLAEVSEVFSNALRRTQVSWRLSLAMTVISFIIIAVMIACAVIFSIATGQSQWALVFGGTSIAGIIGTLIWKPYDRLFRATILSQEVEMIHVRTTAGFRGTLDFKERMQICEEGFIALQTIFREHASEKTNQYKSAAGKRGKESSQTKARYSRGSG